MKLTLIALSLFSIFFADASEAARRQRRTTPAVSHTPPSCGDAASAEAPVKMDEHTVYMPGKGGINGNCRGGASAHKGFPACKNTLDKFIAGKSKWVHTAAQQNGGSSVLFGCWAATDDLKNKKVPTGNQNSCHLLAIADHYGKSEDAGKRGIARTRYGNRSRGVIGAKVDIEVDSNSKYAKVVNGAASGSAIKCLGRLPGVTNRERPGRREVERDANAVSSI